VHSAYTLVNWFSRKLVKLVPPDEILKLKCTKFDFRWRSTPDPASAIGDLTALPQTDPRAEFKWPTSKGREGKGKEGKGGERKGEGEGGGERPDAPCRKFLTMSLLAHKLKMF